MGDEGTTSQSKSFDDKESDGGGIDDSFTNMINNIVPNDDGNHEFQDDEIASALADIEQPEDFGAPVRNHIAEAYVKTVSRPLSKETCERVKKQFRIPENCKQLRVPRMNPELWLKIPAKARLQDHEYQKVQATLASTLSSLATFSEEIAARATEMPKDLVTKLLKCALDSANLVGNQMQDLNTKRRMEVKPFLNPEYAGICSAEIKPSELLFGSTLAETLKSTRATATVIKNSTYQENRYRPYPQAQSPLNSYRPYQHSRGRWNNGQTRPRMITRPPQYSPSRPAFQNNYQRRQF